MSGDHRVPWASGGPTAYENLNLLCRPGHKEKPERDRQLGLLNPSDERGPP